MTACVPVAVTAPQALSVKLSTPTNKGATLYCFLSRYFFPMGTTRYVQGRLFDGLSYYNIVLLFDAKAIIIVVATQIIQYRQLL